MRTDTVPVLVSDVPRRMCAPADATEIPVIAATAPAQDRVHTTGSLALSDRAACELAEAGAMPAINLTATETSETAHLSCIESNVNSMKQILEWHDRDSSIEKLTDSMREKSAHALMCSSTPGRSGHDHRRGQYGCQVFTPHPGLYDAAWGLGPGCWPLPRALEPIDRWHRAVALGGQGRYSAASAELDAADRAPRLSAPVRSLLASTRASWARQMGRHVAAARYDGAAIAFVGFATPPLGRETPDASDPDALVAQARCDALTGLAADALGIARFGTAETLLARCAEELARDGRAEQLWRQRLRLSWVRSELAMISGDGPSALRYAFDARELATETVSLRHAVKTELIVAAALCSVGDVDRSLDAVRGVLDACSEHGLVPLRWAAAMLWNGLGETETSPSIIAECVAVLARRGGLLAVA